MDIRSSSCAPTCLARIIICSFISPVRLRHYCASASFYSVEEEGLIAPSLEAMPLGPQPPLQIAAGGSSTSFGLLQPDGKISHSKRRHDRDAPAQGRFQRVLAFFVLPSHCNLAA